MTGDYVSIRTVDNGFTVNKNEYGQKGERISLVAKDEAELLKLLASLYERRQEKSDQPVEHVR